MSWKSSAPHPPSILAARDVSLPLGAHANDGVSQRCCQPGDCCSIWDRSAAPGLRQEGVHFLNPLFVLFLSEGPISRARTRTPFFCKRQIFYSSLALGGSLAGTARHRSLRLASHSQKSMRVTLRLPHKSLRVNLIPVPFTLQSHLLKGTATRVL